MRLETDPAWTARMRSELAQHKCEPCDLVLLIANVSEYPRMRDRVPLIGESLIVVGTIGEVADSGLPIANMQALTDPSARSEPDRSHAVILNGVHAVAIRFRLPQ